MRAQVDPDQFWVGLFHAVTRSLLVVLAWFLLPDYRFVAIPAVIVIVYVISIIALATRELPGSASR